MSVDTIIWARSQRTGSPAAKACLYSMAFDADMDGVVRKPIEDIARETEQSVADVEASIRDLMRLGLVEASGAAFRLSVDPWVPKPREKGPPGWEELRRAAFARDGNACVYCGCTGPLQCDHVIPRSRGGSHELTNLATACGPCNASKRDRTLEEWKGRI